MNVNETIAEYMPLIKSEIKRWHPVLKSQYTKQDLLSHGMEAVWRCTKPGKYTPGEVTFGQYAKQAIKNEMGQLLIKSKTKDKDKYHATSTTVTEDSETTVIDLESHTRNPVYNLDLYHAMDKLHITKKEIVHDIFFLGKEPTEIAAERGVTKQRILNIKRDAIAKLKELTEL